MAVKVKPVIVTDPNELGLDLQTAKCLMRVNGGNVNCCDCHLFYTITSPAGVKMLRCLPRDVLAGLVSMDIGDALNSSPILKMLIGGK